MDLESGKPQEFGPKVAGRALFLCGLAVWVGVSARLLPFDFKDLAYLFSLERGLWVTQEWVHPLYIPLLHVYKGLLGIFGWGGPMLMPVEALNMGTAAATLIGIYLYTEKRCGDSVAACAGTLVLGFSYGFWTGCLRPTPYALAAACCVASLILLLERRWAWAGLLAGLAVAFHASALALVPVVVVAVGLEGGDRRERFFRFLGAMFAVILLSYGLFMAMRGIGPEYFRRQGLGQVFRGIEQIPGTSLYTSRSLWAQLHRTLLTLWEQGFPAVALSLALIGFGALAGVPKDRRAPVLALANFAAFLAFFVINNSRNGFLFASLLLIPPAWGALLQGRVRLRALYVPACAAVLFFCAKAVASSGSGAAGEPLLAEVRFLERFLGSRDIVLMPGCPHPEALYLRDFGFLEVGRPGELSDNCEASQAVVGPELAVRVRDALASGRRVYFNAGDVEADFSGDALGAQKTRQIFFAADLSPAGRSARVLAVLESLEGAFRLGGGQASPLGPEYIELTH